MRIGKHAVRPAYVGLGLLYVAVLVFVLASDDTVAETGRLAFGIAGLAAAVRAARHDDGSAARRDDGSAARTRQGWWAVAAGFGILILTTPLMLLIGDAADDIEHLGFVAALLVALQRFPLAPAGPRERWKSTLDATTVLIGGAMLLWYTVFGPYGLKLDSAIYPIADLALLFCVVRALLRGADRPLRLFAGGAFVLFAGYALHAYLHGQGETELHTAWHLICWITADALIAAAAVEQCSSTKGEAPRDVEVARYLPIAAIATTHGLMIVAALVQGEFYPWGGLALGGAVLSALVLFRQSLVQHESDDRAVTDGLTGLANRSRIREASNRSLARDARTGRYSAALMIDLNGFKQVNDTLGHKSGDLVLVEFARLLRRCVPSGGLPARLGGDEFAVILSDLGAPEKAYEIAGEIAASIAPVMIEGRLVTPACSIGVAVSGPGELTHEELVHRADVAMYRAKKLGPDTRWAAWQASFEEQASTV
jgi:diguanylate cyclase (GGDEF)-like protein